MRYFHNKETRRVLEIGDRGEVIVYDELRIVEPAAAPAPTAPTAGNDAGGGEHPRKRGRKPKMMKNVPRKETAKPHKKGSHKCSKCGEYGHIAKTCGRESEAKPSESAEQALNQMRFVPITPDKLHKIKSMLSEGEPVSFIAQEVGVGEDRIERIKEQLKL